MLWPALLALFLFAAVCGLLGYARRGGGYDARLAAAAGRDNVQYERVETGHVQHPRRAWSGGARAVYLGGQAVEGQSGAYPRELGRAHAAGELLADNEGVYAVDKAGRAHPVGQLALDKGLALGEGNARNRGIVTSGGLM